MRRVCVTRLNLSCSCVELDIGSFRVGVKIIRLICKRNDFNVRLIPEISSESIRKWFLRRLWVLCTFGVERFAHVGAGLVAVVGLWGGEKMPDESAMVEEDTTEKEEEGEKREIGKLAVWTVSSNKPGNGVEMLRDNNLTTYWQSDGAQPHLVNIQFQKKVRLQQFAIYVDFKVDESYTPNKISIRAGNSFHDLREIKVVDLVEPTGWVYISLCPNDSKDFLRAFFMQLAVLSNHQNGRDTHIRQIKIYGPRQAAVIGHPFEFTTIEFNSHSTIR